MWLLRKIELSKWAAPGHDLPGMLAADAITGSLRTSGNTLSFWQFDSVADLAEAQLAYLGTINKVEKLHFVVLTKADCERFDLQQSEGKTAYKARAMTHFDMTRLNYRRLGEIATLVAEQIRADNSVLLTKNDVRARLEDALANGKIVKQDMDQKLQAEF